MDEWGKNDSTIVNIDAHGYMPTEYTIYTFVPFIVNTIGAVRLVRDDSTYNRQMPDNYYERAAARRKADGRISSSPN